MNTIKIKDYLSIQEELVAVAAVTPGMLLEQDSAGKVKPHATSGGPVSSLFAFEDELQGKGIDDAYAIADPVQVWIPTRGDMVNAFLADGENAAVGDFLISDGAGALKVYDASPGGVVVAQALEAVDLTAAGAVGRIQVRVV